MKSARWFVSYIAVAVAGLGLALTLSLRFLAPAHSQNSEIEAPSSGELPPEFMDEVNKTQVPSNVPSQPKVPTTVDSIPPTEPPVTEPEAEPAVTESIDESTAASPTNVSSDGYTYDPTGRRDPFTPFKTIPLPGAKLSDVVPLEPLQRWDLDKLKVIGILWEVQNPRAMLKDPDGQVYTAVKNTKIGRNNGYVTAIREGEVIVVETFDVEGTTNKETKILELGN